MEDIRGRFYLSSFPRTLQFDISKNNHLNRSAIFVCTRMCASDGSGNPLSMLIGKDCSEQHGPLPSGARHTHTPAFKKNRHWFCIPLLLLFLKIKC
jgi:hypothetical protein